jgi:hypothetical protein
MKAAPAKPPEKPAEEIGIREEKGEEVSVEIPPEELGEEFEIPAFLRQGR